MKYLLRDCASLEQAVKSAGHILFCSDFDGTLTPLYRRPGDVVFSEKTRDKLAALSRQPDYTVAVVSGRGMDDLRSAVKIEGIYYAANHGLEIYGPGLDYKHPAADQARPLMQGILGRLHAALDSFEGAIIEDKGFSLSVHYRLVLINLQDEVVDLIREACASSLHGGQIRFIGGKKVWNIFPDVSWDKGRAVELLHQHVNQQTGQDSLLIYLGDDVTDEDALRMAKKRGGWPIFVGGPESCTHTEYFLPGYAEVAQLIDRLAALR